MMISRLRSSAFFLAVTLVFVTGLIAEENSDNYPVNTWLGEQSDDNGSLRTI